MQAVSKPDISVKNATTTLTIGLTTFFEVLAGLIENNTLRVAIISLIPIVVFGIIYLGNQLVKEINYKRGVKYYTKLIARRKKDLLETVDPLEIEHLKTQIREHENTLDKLGEDHYKILTE